MVSVKEISLFLGYWGIPVIAIGSLIGAWLLTGGKKWCEMQWRFLKASALMPGPSALPLIGNAHLFVCREDEMLNRIVNESKPYNDPFRFWMGTKLGVVIRNPRDIEVILNSPIATNKPIEYRFLASYLGPGIVTNSGSSHIAQRKLVVPMVNGKPLDTFIECFDRQSRRCVKCLEDRVDAGEFDIMHYMDDCTLDVILETIIGTVGTAQDNGYRGLIDCSTRAIGLADARTMTPWLYRDWVYYRTEAGKEFAKAMKVLHEFVETFIAQKKEEHAEDSPAVKPSMAVLDQLIIHNAKTKLMDDKQLRDEVANIWIPAQDPTALTSSFLFLMLGMHPEIQEKVRAEVREVIGDEDITPERISKLKYLDMVFKETVRLFPVGPVILRELQSDLDLETCTAPEGCTIAVLVYMTHRDPNHWTEPEKFNPDRFTRENSVGRHRYAYVPFSGGVRGCIGQQYATMLVKTLVSRVVQKYRISSEGSLETLRLKAGVSIRSIDGYKVSITRV